MTRPAPPHFDQRRRKELRAELLARAQMWIPEWRPGGTGSDVLASFLEIAARLDADVTQRLDRVPEKSFRGLLHWLGRRGKSGQVARMPVVFKMSDRAEPVLAAAPVQLQADAGGTPVIFETEASIRLIASRLDAIVASQGDDDFYVAFPGLAELAAPAPAPSTWRLVTPAEYGSTQVQLDPPEGLALDMVLADDAERKYRITEVKDGLVKLSDALGSAPGTSAIPTGFYEGSFTKADHFSPFDGQERNRQEHAFYIGAKEKLDVETAATIRLDGDLPADCNWSYWGKVGNSESGWQELTPDEDRPNLLSKKKGAIEELEIAKTSLRWLRATPKDPGNVSQQNASDIRIAINCTGDQSGQAAGNGTATANGSSNTQSIALEAIANSTPVVLNQGFYPFGREPRQFDSFYISGPEAFGKPKALATITINLADGFDAVLNAVGSGQGATLVAGVGNDLGLHMVHVSSSAGGDKVRFLPAARPETGPGQPIKFGRQRVGAVYDAMADVAFFSATDGATVWVWKSAFLVSTLPDTLSATLGNWEQYGKPDDDAKNPIVETFLVVDNGLLKIYAVLAEGQVHWRPLSQGSSWQPLLDDQSQPVIDLKRLVPFENSSETPGLGSDALGLAGFNAKGELVYCEQAGGTWHKVDDFKAIDIGSDIPYPLALIHDGARRIFTAATRKNGEGKTTTLEALRVDPAGGTVATPLDGELIGNALSFVMRDNQKPAIIYAIDDPDGKQTLRLWQPFDDPEPLDLPLPLTPLRIAQPPIRLSRGYLIPLEHGAIAWSDTLNGPTIANQRTDGELVSIALSAEMPEALPDKVLLELPAFSADKFYIARTVEDIGFVMPSLRKQAQDGISGFIHERGTTPFKGTIRTRRKIELDSTDNSTAQGMKLCIYKGEDEASGPGDTLYEVTNIVVTNAGQPNEKRVAEIEPRLSAGNGKRTYFQIDRTSTELSFDTRPTVLLKGNVTEQFELDRVVVEFAGTQFSGRLRQLPFEDGTGSRLILADSWVGAAPADNTAVMLVQQAQASTAITPPAPRNPELSWEYWNGTGWWQISDLTDDTQNLVRSGNVEFCVPADLKPTDVAGRPGSWIRARLVGGDYGQETVRVITTQGQNANESVQTVVRDPSTIRAPFVVSLLVNYELCCAVAPDRILTLDSGGYRDQTEINLAQNASVKVFTQLSESLRQAQPTNAGAAAPAAQDCKCADGDTVETDGQGAAAAGSGENDKALYLGFSEPLQGQGVSLLVIVEEAKQTIDPRLSVEAFADGTFRPIQVKDETRALTESGIITLSFSLPLQRVSLFGQSLHWLRLKPDPGEAKDWSPKIGGIYLNSVWASAGETHGNEVVGRSDGSPSQVFRLAHADVVDGTLQLRVKEPLGDEEIDALTQHDKTEVLAEIGLWQGPWVRWRRGDLATARTGERIFDFDSALGVVTFGDGRRGAIPPIGSDNIVAVTYRSGANATGNRVGAWNKPNLISPLRGVQEVLTPEGAAGGNDAQTAEQALLFASSNIAMRDRAITLADFERQAVQSSPDIVQAKAIGRSKGITVVAVRRGPDPNPTAAMRRALERYLKERSSSAFRRAGAFAIEGPAPVAVAISVVVTVADLALAGTVAEAVSANITGLLDTATGGIDELGWPLGVMVSEADLSAVISDIADVMEIDRMTIRRIDGLATPIRENELITLSETNLSIACLQSEEEAA